MSRRRNIYSLEVLRVVSLSCGILLFTSRLSPRFYLLCAGASMIENRSHNAVATRSAKSYSGFVRHHELPGSTLDRRYDFDGLWTVCFPSWQFIHAVPGNREHFPSLPGKLTCSPIASPSLRGPPATDS